MIDGFVDRAHHDADQHVVGHLGLDGIRVGVVRVVEALPRLAPVERPLRLELLAGTRQPHLHRRPVPGPIAPGKPA